LKPLSQVLYTLFEDQPTHGQWVVACLEGSWSRVLGEKLASVCRPVTFDKSNLWIEILDRDWDQILQSIQPDLLEKLRAATANEVKGISFSRQWAAGSKI